RPSLRIVCSSGWTGTGFLYRAVSFEEADEVEVFGESVTKLGFAEGKYFTDSIQEAERFGESLFANRQSEGFRIIEDVFPAEIVDEMYKHPNMDGNGVARFADEEQLMRQLGARVVK